MKFKTAFHLPSEPVIKFLPVREAVSTYPSTVKAVVTEPVQIGDAVVLVKPRAVGQPKALFAPYGAVGDAGMQPATKPVAELKDHVVVLHNNDRTPFENVTKTLEKVFKLHPKPAMEKMYEAHNSGAEGKTTVSWSMTKAEADALAKEAMKFASKLDNKRGSTLRFSVKKV